MQKANIIKHNKAKKIKKQKGKKKVKLGAFFFLELSFDELTRRQPKPPPAETAQSR